jgi:endoglucanase
MALESSDPTRDAIDIWISPNPLGEQSTVAFYLPSQTEVLLQLRDMNGNLMRTLQSGTFEGGYHQRVFDTSFLPAGMYFLLLTAGPESVVKRIVVLN